MLKKLFISVAASFLLLVFPAHAQRSMPRIGVFTFNLARGDEDLKGFFEEFRRLGWIEGQNITVEFRTAEGNAEQVNRLVADLVQLKVDAIVASSTPTALAAQKATKTIPIVFMSVADPVASGLVATLARPGANITGVSNVQIDLAGKRLELLKDTVRKLSRVTVVSNPADPISAPQLKEVGSAARALGLQLQRQEVSAPKDLEGLASNWAKSAPGALYVITSQMFVGERKRIVDISLSNRVPSIFWSSRFVDSGGLMSYGTNIADLNRRAAVYVDKILKGAKPADLPVEQPTKFELVINLKTAKQIGLTIPPNVLARADRVIK
jgi:ABC-type uncharacterized transport system substrate-binding protein